VRRDLRAVAGRIPERRSKARLKTPPPRRTRDRRDRLLARARQPGKGWFRAEEVILRDAVVLVVVFLASLRWF